ncbi:dihydrofolate reductase [Aspergillus novofumigatus IBT 16806]|uniref:Dihydrofolate reductase n=1 Tax=Aspergillus novofumigatus (strain IBT 16806) TaxID=1392255 RepID=A0A2I1CM66_ASPN1|nr:putative dihydrofolate reductase [Aspergillus novofumigatus IBT 16806]PKX98712.1 putative dihydrofolate reductase [Aspergillus novofumigatus IBT 16806]
MPPSQPLTLIVATTPIRTSENLPTRLGIGLHGTLPWPRIKADMAFFARATSRPPRPGTTNAIVMGRKTYDSLPQHLRPLAKRINVVITRDATGSVRERIMRELEAKRAKAVAVAAAEQAQAQAQKQEQAQTDALVSTGLEDALASLEGGYGAEGKLGNVFVIGGAEIYASVLRMSETQPVRIVMTNVERVDGTEFECDTFFPVDEELSTGEKWRMASEEEVSGWVGEQVSSKWREEGDVRIQMVGYERIL